ncbi:uncharacterized protein LOC119116965 isoform X2 [Syngnathus acus]|uniref:uncharacterized protein LOC119116965 isoform X2 n=1 Tax=Syngnathus acus TaxID=161584 RepID=UPI001885B60E|nr:uncharacterized protein LOC119116965 isoform X2 [Syngnathus acus]
MTLSSRTGATCSFSMRICTPAYTVHTLIHFLSPSPSQETKKCSSHWSRLIINTVSHHTFLIDTSFPPGDRKHVDLRVCVVRACVRARPCVRALGFFACPIFRWGGGGFVCIKCGVCSGLTSPAHLLLSSPTLFLIFRSIIMKAVGIAALVSLRLLGVLALLLIGCVRRGEAGPVFRPLSPVLRSPNTYRAAEEVSLHAQRSETEEESNVRLNVPVADEEHVVVCCLHSNILDFYLKDVFDGLDDRHPRMHQLHSDLSRAGQDLKEHGCNAPHYQDHRHVVQFRDKLAQMDSSRGLKKALSEVNILFTYLHDNCVSAAR